MRSFLPKRQESQQRTINTMQIARIAHRKCWIKTTAHQCGLMSTVMDPLTQQSETAGVGSTSFSNGKTLSRSLVAGALSSDYRAELSALLDAARLLSAETPPLSHIVFLTDCKSAVQSLQSPREQLERDTQRLLYDLLQRCKVAVQWIPAHCGLAKN